MAAARVTAHWRQHGRVVVPLMPPTTDTDFNDLVLMKDRNAHCSKPPDVRSADGAISLSDFYAILGL